jgi:hypothetical protein
VPRSGITRVFPDPLMGLSAGRIIIEWIWLFKRPWFVCCLSHQCDDPLQNITAHAIRSVAKQKSHRSTNRRSSIVVAGKSLIIHD